MTFRGRRASLLYQIRLGAWRSKSTIEIRSIMKIYNFCWALVVSVLIAEVVNTLLSWLHWMSSSYVGRLDTKTTSLRSACRKYLGMTTALPT
jgi:hypothetical protein